MKYKLLLVDDHSLYLRLTKEFLEKHHYFVDTATSGFEAMGKLSKNPHGYTLLVLDYFMKGKNGAEIAQEILAEYPHAVILIASNDQSREVLRQSWKAGAVDFIDKGAQPEEFLRIIAEWCEKSEQTKPANTGFSETDNSRVISSIGLVGVSKSMAEVAELAIRYQSMNKNVLVLGESGTGKERIARSLHKGNDESFFAVNCAIYNGDSNLMEAELFGYEKGAFTGANKDKKGIFEEAGKGTIFLDEIHTLSFKAQQKLLRALQEKKVRPVGSAREYPVSFRLVAASKPNLEALVEAKEFLLDLYYRLNVLRIDVPALRSRPEDIGPLVQHFVKRFETESKEKKEFLQGSIKLFEGYSWPGNVRELENTVERLCATITTPQISPEQLDAKFVNSQGWDQLLPTLKKRFQPMEADRERVLEILRVSKSQREAARRLGVPSSTFHDYLRRLGIAKGQMGGGRKR